MVEVHVHPSGGFAVAGAQAERQAVVAEDRHPAARADALVAPKPSPNEVA